MDENKIVDIDSKFEQEKATYNYKFAECETEEDKETDEKFYLSSF
jgi:hypothetical protein